MTASPHARAGVVHTDEAVPLARAPLGALRLARATDTGGSVSFVIHDLAPRALGSPVHTHSREDEWSYVLSGEVGVQIGDETMAAGPGDLVLKPRNVPHAFWNPSDEPARFLEVITPGGFEEYFAVLGELFAAGGPPDTQRLADAAGQFGLVLDPASIPALVQEHGLVLP